jgi:hypothetical protein
VHDDASIAPPVPGRVVIDVSNVCHSAELPPRSRGPNKPFIDRLTMVVDAWQARHGAAADIRCVADASARARIGAAAWRPVERRLDIEVDAYADELILGYARDERRYVLSGDRFVDHRHACPWIDERPERFLHWRHHNGAVEFRPSGIRPQPDWIVSERSEVKRLRDAGLDPKRDRALLETRWRCETPSCPFAQAWQKVLLSWPERGRDGHAACPWCKAQLAPAGQRGVFCEVVVSTVDGGEELTRFPLEHDVPVVVGRGRRDQGISLDNLPGVPEHIGRLSRQHALLELDERRRLHVVDLGSTNGTAVRAAAGAPAVKLDVDERASVGVGGRVELAGVLRLELSGKRFLSALPEQPPPSTDDSGTEFAPVTGATER